MGLLSAAGWTESEKVFTDALQKLLTSSSASSGPAEAAYNTRQQAASRRLLAASTHTSSQASTAASMLQQPSLNQAEQHSMHSADLQASSDQTEKHSTDSMVITPTDLPSADSFNSTEQRSAASAPGSCLAADSTSVCRDEHQPAWEAPDWEQHSRTSFSNPGLELQQCQLLNASMCAASVQMTKEGKRTLVVVYNSLAWERATEPVRVPVSMPSDVTTHWLVTGVPLVAVIPLPVLPSTCSALRGFSLQHSLAMSHTMTVKI